MKKVNEVSRLAGVSKRTLQYYDDEGLVLAERSKDNYRLYDEAALEKLWQILIYKEMEFKLKEIKHLLTLSDSERKTYLEHNVESLMQQTAHLNEQIRFISFIQSHGMPSIVSEGDEDGMTYVEYIANLREEWKTGDEHTNE